MSLNKYYKIRVDTDNLQSIETILKKYSSSYIVCLENEGTDNTHTHSYIETIEKQATIRNVLRKEYGSGNASYSMKELDEEKPIEYLAYVVKEKIYRHNMPQEVIDKAIAHDKSIKESIKEKKINKKTQLEKLIEIIEPLVRYEDKDAHYPIIIDKQPHLESFVRKEWVLEHVIEFYRKGGMLVREFQIISLTKTLCLKYIPGYASSLRVSLIDKI